MEVINEIVTREAHVFPVVRRPNRRFAGATIDEDTDPQGEMKMTERIEENLAEAFAAESKAAARNEAFALKAESEGYPELAHLFRAVANSESVHARRFLNLMRGKIGTTEANLQAAYENEIRAKDEKYPAMVQDAKEASKARKKAFVQSMHTDGEHAEFLKLAMEDKLAGRQTDYYVCQICGHISENSIPDNCPICKAVPTRFKKVR
jgi:rubrerythrin